MKNYFNPPFVQSLTDQLYNTMYLPALFPGYATEVTKPDTAERALPAGLTRRDLNFFDPHSRLFYLPYALFSAGLADLKNPISIAMLHQRPSTDSCVLADSGGYQVISGNFNPNTDTKREQVFRWQEANAEVGITLDIPTACIAKDKNNYNSFAQCLKGTLSNLKVYDRLSQSSQLRLLNVLQGRDPQEADDWYKAVKRYRFRGWAFAGPMKDHWFHIIRRILTMIDEGQFEEDQRYIHFLGRGTVQHACLLTVLRDSLREKLDDETVHLSLDTASPFRSAGEFNDIYHTPTFSRKKFGYFTETIERGDPRLLGSTKPFPYPQSPIGSVMTMGDLIVNEDIHADSRWDNLSAAMVMNHNVYVHTCCILHGNSLLKRGRSYARQYVPKEILDARDAIQGILSSKNPLRELAQAKSTLDKVNGRDAPKGI